MLVNNHYTQRYYTANRKFILRDFMSKFKLLLAAFIAVVFSSAAVAAETKCGGDKETKGTAETKCGGDKEAKTTEAKCGGDKK